MIRFTIVDALLVLVYKVYKTGWTNIVERASIAAKLNCDISLGNYVRPAGTMEPHYTFTWMFELGQVTSGLRFGLHEAPISHSATIFCGSGRKKRLYTKQSQKHHLNWELQSGKSFKRYQMSS